MLKSLKPFIIMAITIIVMATAGCASEPTNPSNPQIEYNDNNYSTHSTTYNTSYQNNNTTNAEASFTHPSNNSTSKYVSSINDKANRSTNTSAKINQQKNQSIVIQNNIGSSSYQMVRTNQVKHYYANLNDFIKTHEYFEASVVKVVDGDTVYVEALNGTEYKIRLLGVDTPETYTVNKPDEYILLDGTPITDLDWLKEWGYKAKDFAKMNLENKVVIVVFDNIAPKKGYYGRYLSYIYFNNSGVLDDFNEELLENGYARVYVSQFEKLNEYQQVEYYAKSHNIGLWNWIGDSSSETAITTTNENMETIEENTKPTVSTTGTSIIISYIHADAAGNDHYNLNDEYIVIKNVGSSSVDLSGWEVRDEAGHNYVFPSGFVLGSGAEVMLHTGSGVNSNSDLYWGSSKAIWNNNGDTIYVIDDSGNVVISKHYS